MQCGRPRFDSWVGKIPWRRKWQPTPILWPGKFHGRRSPVGYSPWGHKELDTTERLHFTADKKLGLSRWGGFAPGWISPGGSSEARGPLREAYGRSAPGPCRERSAPPQTPRQWSQVSGVSIAPGNAHFVGSWVPIDWHPVSGAEGCGPQVGSVAQGGAGTHVFRPLCWHSLGAP